MLNVSKLKITKSTSLKLHRKLHYHPVDSTPTLQNKLFKISEKIYLRKIERVPREFLSLLEGHYLDVECPWGELFQCDSIVQVTCSVVWVGAGEFCSFCWRQVLDTLVSLQIATSKVIDHLRTGRIFYNYYNVLLPGAGTVLSANVTATGRWLALPLLSPVHARDNRVWVWLAVIGRRASDSLRT